MSLQKHENTIRKKLQQHTMPVDSDALWKNIRPEVRKRKSHRALFLWLFLGLIIGVGSWQLAVDNEQLAIDNEQLTIDSEQLTIDSKQLAIDSKQLAIDNEQLTVGRSVSTTNNEQLTMCNKSSVSTTSNVQRSTYNKSSVSTTNNVQRTIYDESSVSTTRKEQRTTNNESVDGSVSTTHNESIDNDQLPVAGYQLTVDSPEFIIHNSSFIIAYFTPTQKSTLRPYIEFGGAQPQSTITANTVQDNTYAQNIRNTEKPLAGIQAEVGLLLQLRSGIYFRSGLSISRITEQLNIQTNSIGTDTIYDIYYSNASGQQELAREVTTTTKQYARLHSHYHLIDVPFIAGYMFKRGKFKIGVEGGIYANAGVISNGAFLTSSNTITKFNNNKNNPYTHNTALSYYISSRFQVRILNTGALYIKPYWRSSTGNLYKSDIGVLKKHQWWGANIGLVF